MKRSHASNYMKPAFTLAEVLATLGVIGVIAMVTIPSVVTDYRIQSFKAQKQAFASNFAGALNMMSNYKGAINKASADASRTATEVFVQDYLTEYFKLSRTCKPDDITNCGFQTSSSVYQTPGASGYVTLPFKNSSLNNFGGDDNMWGALSVNGISMMIAYNPDCLSTSSETEEADYVKDTACVNVIYDVNGEGGPNIVGMDVGFLTVFYSKKAKTGAPVIYHKESSTTGTAAAAEAHCTKLKSNGSIGLPTAEEEGSMLVNSALLGLGTDPSIWSMKKMVSSIDAQTTGSSVFCAYR